MLPKDEYVDALGVGRGERYVMDGWMNSYALVSESNYAIYVQIVRQLLSEYR